MSQEQWLPWFSILAGLFSLGGAVFEWGFFMDSRKAQALSRLIGRLGARIFYGAIGVLLLGLGFGFLTGAIPCTAGS